MIALRVVSLVALLAVGFEAGGFQQISRSGAGAYEASLAPLGSGFAVSWYDTRHGRPELYARLIGSSGVLSGPELRLTESGTSYEPDVAARGSDLIIGWYESDSRATFRAMLGSWSGTGRRLWSTQLSTPAHYGRNPLVRVDGSRIFAAWLESTTDGLFEVRAQWFDLSGRPLGGARSIAPGGRTTWNLNAAIDRAGRAWLAFDARAQTRADELFLAIVDQKESQTYRLTADDGFASKYPDLGFAADGTVALTWFDERDGNEEVYLMVGSPAQIVAQGEPQAIRVTATPGASIGAYLAWNGNRLGLVWCDNTAGQHEIYFEPFDQAGRALEPPRQVTENVTESLIPAIRPAGEGFAMVWNEVTPGPSGGHDPRSRSEVLFATVTPGR